MVFKSQHPDINLSPNQALWTWLFESQQSSYSTSPKNDVQGFTDAITKQHISFHDVRSHTTHLSTALKNKFDIGEGDSVIVFSKNSIWYPVATLAAIRIGAIASGVSPDYNVEELSFALSLSKARVIITGANMADTAYQVAASAGIPSENVILIEGSKDSMPTVQGLIQEAKGLGDAAQASAYSLPRNKTNKDVCSYLCFSSGTTGLPKAVMVSHANVMAQCLQVQQITPSDHKRILAALPFYHITGIVHQLHLPIVLNARVYVVPTYTLDTLLQTVSEYKIKELLIVPPILVRLVQDEKTVSKYDLSHVERFSSGAAPLPRSVLDRLEKKFPGTGFKQGYGLTESCSAITSHPPSKYAYKYADKVGMVVASTEVKIADVETGEDCPVGKEGEILARGPQIAMGYLNNPAATSETFDKDGFLHTGDIGKVDEEGLLAITDRKKEMIKVKGIGVAPAELENLLLGHPLVSDVAVCRVADERAGERPKAYVVVAPSPAISPEEAGRILIEYVKSKKTRHKWIKEMEFIQAIPKSPAGKILRRKLTEEVGGIVVRDEVIRARL